MNKAIIALYVIVAGQSLLIILAFTISYIGLGRGLEQMGMQIREFCDSHYVHQEGK